MIDIEQVVDTLGVQKLVTPTKLMGDWYQCKCPFHSGGNEKKPSFGIRLKEEYRAGSLYPAGFAHCFACGYAGDLEKFITDVLKQHDIEETGESWLAKYAPGYEHQSEFEYLVPEGMMDAITSKYAVNQIQEMMRPKNQYVSEEELASYRFTVPYMYERKMTDEVIEKYDIGYDANWIPPGRKNPVPCITIPIRDVDGNTLFFCRRSIQGKLYNYPQGVVKPVFGLDVLPKDTKSIVVCESAINAITATVYGYNAVALLGTGNSYQIQQLKELGVRDIVLCMDGDEAGRRATTKLKKALSSVAFIWTIDMPDGKDLNDCTKEEFDALYTNRS